VSSRTLKPAGRGDGRGRERERERERGERGDREESCKVLILEEFVLPLSSSSLMSFYVLYR